MNMLKPYGKYLLWAGLLVIWAGGAAAAGESETVSGFSGYIQPMLGVASVKSWASVRDDNKRIDSLDQKAESKTEFVPMLTWNAGYAFGGGNTRVWLGSSEDSSALGGGLFEMGASHTLSDGSRIVLAYTPPVLDDDVWTDPFLTGKDRAETHLYSQSFRMAAESLFGLPLSLAYTFAVDDVDDDQAGQSLSLSAKDLEVLKRSGKHHQADVRYDFDLGAGFVLTPGVRFARGNADGAANRFDLYGGGLTLSYGAGKASFFTSATLSRTEYDEVHPVFGKTREDDRYGLALGMSYQAPFDKESLSLCLFAALDRQDSNIGFYDESAFVSGIGIKWAF